MGKRYKYTTVSISEEMAQEIEKFMREHPELGYTSISEFVREAIRSHLEEKRKKRDDY